MFHHQKRWYLHTCKLCAVLCDIIILLRLGLRPARAFSWQVELWTGQTPPSLCLHINCGGLRFSNELNGWTETFFSGRFLTFVSVYRVELISPVGASGLAVCFLAPFYVSVHARVIQCVHAAGCNSFLFTLSLFFFFFLFGGLGGQHERH